jgi:hypothetical protein
MPNTCDLPIILTGGGRSPVMPGTHGKPPICATRPSGSVGALCAGDPFERVAPADWTHRTSRPLADPGLRVAVGAERSAERPSEQATGQVTEQGSQTTEYALLLIVAATITMLALTWAKKGGVTNVLDGVIAQVLAMFGIGGG